jgi:hypothetical protein
MRCALESPNSFTKSALLSNAGQHRITASDLVMVGWHDGIGKLNQLGNMLDLSLSGMGVLVYDALR